MKLILALLLIIYLGFQPRWHYTLSGDIKNYYQPIANHIFTANTLIYPPGANLVFLIFGKNELTFVAANIFLILVLGYLFKNSYLWLIILGAGPMILYRFDLFVMFLVVMAIKSFSRANFAWSGIFLGAAVMTKFFPIVLLPYFLLVLWPKKRIVLFLTAFLFSALLILLIYLGITNLSLSTVINGLSFNLSKSVHMESVLGSALTIITSVTNPGPHGVRFENALWVLDPLYFLGHARIFQFLPLIGLSFIYGMVFLKKTTQFIPAICISIILVLIISSQVFSPQYLLWPALLFPLYKNNKINLLLLFAALVCTQIIYPLNYGELIDFFNLGINQPLFWIIATRNLLVIILTINVILPILQSKRPKVIV